MTDDEPTTRTLQEVEREIGWWNAYVSRNVEIQCPKTGRVWIGSASACPDCLASLSDLSHWKWYSPDEQHPQEAMDR